MAFKAKRLILHLYNITLIFVVDRGYREELEKEEKRGTSYDRYALVFFHHCIVKLCKMMFITMYNVYNNANKH